MKKFILALLLSALASTSVFGLVACGNNETENDAYHQTYALYVAYAEENNIQPKTYDEWLATIKGKDGKDGENGKSVYELYKQYHTDYTKTEEEFINDLINGELGGSLKDTVEDLAEQIEELKAQLEELSQNPPHTHSFINYVSNGDATCTEDGTKTAICEHCDETRTIKDEGSRLGHSYGTPVYTWSTGNKTCTAKAVCIYDSNHKIEETVNTTFAVTQNRGSGLDELSSATATFTNSVFTSQTKTGIVTEAFDRIINEDEMENVSFTKSSSADGVKTVQPGGKFEYSITITNNNNEDVYVNVSDELPNKVVYVSGCDNVNGNKLSWFKQKVEANSSTTITYTVKNTYTRDVISSNRLQGTVLGTANAKVMDEVVSYSKEIFVQETFNEVDIERIEKGVQALADVNRNFVTGLDIVRKIYQVGFTKEFSITKDAKGMLDDIFQYAGQKPSATLSQDRIDMANSEFYSVIPSIYGGTQIAKASDQLFKGERASTLSKENFVSGDIFIAEENNTYSYYIFYRNRFIDISDDVNSLELTTDHFNVILSKLSSYTRYVGLRLAVMQNTTFSYDKGAKFNDNDDNLTAAQEAVVKTAWSYIIRGTRIQYNDNATSNPFGGNGMLRESIATFQPEWASTKDVSYTNCAMFAFDVYWSALNFRVQAAKKAGESKSDLYQNVGQAVNVAENNFTELLLTSKTMQNMTVEEIREEVYATLAPGDIIYINRTNGAAHILLYVGNGYILNATGSSFSIANKKETVEAAIRIETVGDMFNNTTSFDTYSHYIPALSTFAIIRPLNNYTGTSIPTNTTNRIENLENVVAEKLCSVPVSNTVNCGDLITYTFNIRNFGDSAKTINIEDYIPDNTEFVSATGDCVNFSNKLLWELVVGSDEKISVSYTVKVKNVTDIITSTTYNKIYPSNDKLAKVNGTTVKTHGLLISNTLTSSEQQTLLSAVETVKTNMTSATDGVVVANAIYNEAFGITNAMGTSSVYNYIPIVNCFEIDDTKIGMKASGNVGDTVSFTASATYSVSKANQFADANGRLRCYVKSTKLACEIVGVDANDKIIEIKTLSTSNTTSSYYNFVLSSGVKNNVVKFYVNYLTGQADKYGVYYYDNLNERQTNDEALIVRFNGGSYDTRTSLSLFCLDIIGKPALMIAPSMYGGVSVAPTETSKADLQARFTNRRLFTYTEEDFIIGDILYIADYSYGTVTPKMYMYVGNNTLISLMGNNIYSECEAVQTVYDAFYTTNFYIVLRPSMQNNI